MIKTHAKKSLCLIGMIFIGYTSLICLHNESEQISLTIVFFLFTDNSVERHITIDRTLWGSDQAASLEPEGLRKLVRDIRNVKDILGDGIKVVYESELPIRKKLRRK